jgi:hypothetical protein
MRRALFGLVLMVLLAAPRVEAVTVRDIVELSKAGVGDDVLVALIEVSDRIFTLDASKLRELKESGVSERVMVAMLRSGRTPPAAAVVPGYTPVQPAPAWEAPAPVVYPPAQVVVIDHTPQPVYVPVFVGTTPRKIEQRRTVTVTEQIRPGRFINDGFRLVEVPVQKPAEPVYWGFGGKRRPDTWDPTPKPDGGGS